MRIPAWIAVITFVLLGYFYNGNNVNQLARTTPAFAFSESESSHFKTFQIDRFISHPEYYTCDWSYRDGHYYSNKAPGTTLFALIPYAALYYTQKALGLEPTTHSLRSVNTYILNLLISVLPISIAAAFFYLFLLELQTSSTQAAGLSLILVASTFIFPFSSQIWGHPTAVAFIIITLYSAHRNSTVGWYWAGFFAGLATLTDYLAFISAALFGLYALLQRPRVVPAYIIGGLIPLGIFAWYHWYTFGAPLSPATDYMHPAWVEDNRALGMFGLPNLHVLIVLLLGQYRGILFAMPILAASLYALWRWIVRSKRDRLLWLALTHIILILFANSSFNGWYAGWAAGVRYQIIAMPFWVLALKELQPRAWFAAIPLALVSFINMLSVTASSPYLPDKVDSPIYGYAHTFFFSGNFARSNIAPALEAAGKSFDGLLVDIPWNVGMSLGLDSWLSLMPLALLLSILGALLISDVKRL